MTIDGTVTDVKYFSEESGFHILVLEVDGQKLVATGNFQPVREGESIILEGDFIDHPKFGFQFKAVSIKKNTPKTAEGLIKYLKSGLIKGVGEKTAAAIVGVFGLDALKIIENEPHRLSEVGGISKNKAAAIGKEFNKNKENQDAVIFLQSIGIGILTALKIYRTYGADTVGVVSNNPYQLIDDVDGIGFKTADKIALDLKIDPLSSFRIRAAIVYALKDAGERSGNVFLYKEELTEAVKSLLRLDIDIAAQIDELVVAQKLKRVLIDEREAIYGRATYKAEKGAAVKLISLLNTFCDDGSRQDRNDINEKIEHFQQLNSITLNGEQKSAVLNAYFNNVAIITGGPGTGKTTIIKCLLWLFELNGLTVTLLAPTGRAAKRMNESTQAEASTIHRAIMNFDKEQVKQLLTDVVIVDEVSMVDIFLFNMLLKSLREGTRLIMLGDKDQLPSVGAGNVLSDVMDKLPVTELKQIYRQDKCSRIIANAHLINSGEMPLLNEKNADFFFMRESDNNMIAKTVVELVKTRLPKFLNIEPDKIQTLCPLKNGPAGSINLNTLLAEAVNPVVNGKELRAGATVFHENDKVMQTVNNYRTEWIRENEKGKGVFNGDIGTIVSIFSLEAEVLFEDGRRAVYNSENLEELIPAYAITVHKSQGSEFDAVIIPIATAYPESILTRNLLYTAVTRAKKLVVLIGEEYNIKKIVNNNFVFKRNSDLKHFIDKAQRDYDKLYG